MFLPRQLTNLFITITTSEIRFFVVKFNIYIAKNTWQITGVIIQAGRSSNVLQGVHNEWLQPMEVVQHLGS